MSFEVPEPILNSPFERPSRYWYIREGETAVQREGRRPAFVFKPEDREGDWSAEGVLAPLPEYEGAYELKLVNLVRERVETWRAAGYPGATRTTLELLEWWRRDGRERRLFFAQIEAAETIIFLREARADFLQGVDVPREDVGERKRAEGVDGFLRYACKMATGSGKTTVMGMLAAWSILNKVNDRSDARFSDVVLIVCPNVTIRDRLRELDPEQGDASLYRTRDLVPAHLMPFLTRGRVLVTNWHVFEPQSVQQGGVSAKVVRAGVAVKTREKIRIGKKTATARGQRYLSEEALEVQKATGQVRVRREHRDKQGRLTAVTVDATRHVESDTALLARVLGREVGGKQNILVMNDEAHHAYRIRRSSPDENEDETLGEDDADDFFREATVWVEGLDRIDRLRGINFCLDLSATPYYIGRVGQDTGKPFPWVVSDFGLIDAIESGLVKIPQLAYRDTSGAEIPGYFNIWKWVMQNLTPAERGGKHASPKPEAVLKWAHHPIALLAGHWRETTEQWERDRSDGRPPVFILVCKNTRIAKVIHEWLANDECPSGIAPMKVDGFRNIDGRVNTIRVDSKVVHETDTDGAKGDEARWMRFTLDTVGRQSWPADRQGRPIHPTGFEELAAKLGKALHPPGRDVRCIVSVGMLTEGWDANTVTHVVGLRPFMSQLLCEQVVGRGLRRVSYEIGEDGRFSEEVATVFGVPFHVIPFKAREGAPPPPPVRRHHVHALPERAELEIRFPRVESYAQKVRNALEIDWTTIPPIVVDPAKAPPEVMTKGLNLTTSGRPSIAGPGKGSEISISGYATHARRQELFFDAARELTREYRRRTMDALPAHVVFPQMLGFVQRYVTEKMELIPPAELVQLFIGHYHVFLMETILEAVRPAAENGEAPEIPVLERSRPDGSTADVSFWTSRDVREVAKSQVNYVVADTRRWEQSAAFELDRHPNVQAFVKNAGLGFAIPYQHNGEPHDFVPDFLVRWAEDGPPRMLILETKGYDPLAEVKRAAALRWVAAVNAAATHGMWSFEMARKEGEVRRILDGGPKAST
jgi:type III restriction enzyme